LFNPFFILKTFEGVIEMARCPTCGKEVEMPVKEWDLGKTHVSQYECCGKKFREYVKRV